MAHFLSLREQIPKTCNKRCTFQHLTVIVKGPKHTAHTILCEGGCFDVRCRPTKVCWESTGKTSSFAEKLHFRHAEFQDCNQPLLIFLFIISFGII